MRTFQLISVSFYDRNSICTRAGKDHSVAHFRSKQRLPQVQIALVMSHGTQPPRGKHTRAVNYEKLFVKKMVRRRVRRRMSVTHGVALFSRAFALLLQFLERLHLSEALGNVVTRQKEIARRLLADDTRVGLELGVAM